VVPQLLWGDKDTYHFAFDGIDEGGTVAIDTNCLAEDALSDNGVFVRGFFRMLDVVWPETIVVYGGLPKAAEDAALHGGASLVVFPGGRRVSCGDAKQGNARTGIPWPDKGSRDPIDLSSDWRMMGQERYLKGVRLVRSKWVQLSDNWDHDHCEFCFEKFDATTGPAYCTYDYYHWICDECCDDFRDVFGWVLVDALKDYEGEG
jgi:hypothetical protein